MAKAEILSFSKSVHGDVIATVEVVNGETIITTNRESIRRDLERGVQGRHGRAFVPDDGDDFIRELPYVLTGSRIRARVV